MTQTLYFPGLNWQIDLNPVAFQIGPITANWYGVIIAAGFLVAIIYSFARMKKFGLNEDRTLDVIIAGIIGGIVGARLYYVIFAFDEFKGDPLKIFRIWEGGLAIYGGIIGAILVGWLFCYIRKVKFLPLLDMVGSGFLIGQAIGRWGNFVNIEAFGSNTTLPWGMTSDKIVNYLTYKAPELAEIGITVDPNMPVHPCFLYESIWCLIGFILLHFYTKHRKFDGEMFLMYIGWYGLGRFVIEGLRTDSLMIGTLRVSQVLALLCVIAAVLLIVIIRMRIKRRNDPEYLMLYVNTEESKKDLQALEDSRREYEEKRRAKRAKRRGEASPSVEESEEAKKSSQEIQPEDAPNEAQKDTKEDTQEHPEE